MKTNDPWKRLAETTQRHQPGDGAQAEMPPGFDMRVLVRLRPPRRLAADMQQFRAELRTKVCKAYMETNANIAGELRPEQREKFWQLLKEKSEKRQCTRAVQGQS